MAINEDKELLNLDLAGPLSGAEGVYLVQNGESVYVPLSTLAEWVKNAQTIIPADLPYRGALLGLTADKTGLTFPLNIAWDEALRDTDSFWSAGAPTRFTIPAGVSKVRLFWNVHFEGLNNAGSVFAGLLKNGSFMSASEGKYVGYATRAGTTGFSDNHGFGFTAALDVVEGDYFEVQAQVNMTGMNEINDGSRCFFELEVVETEGSTEGSTV